MRNYFLKVSATPVFSNLFLQIIFLSSVFCTLLSLLFPLYSSIFSLASQIFFPSVYHVVEGVGRPTPPGSVVAFSTFMIIVKHHFLVLFFEFFQVISKLNFILWIVVLLFYLYLFKRLHLRQWSIPHIHWTSIHQYKRAWFLIKEKQPNSLLLLFFFFFSVHLFREM